MDKKDRMQVNLKFETYQDLEELKSTGQSFDGVIQELVDQANPEATV